MALLANGNYVISSPGWNNFEGAATWGSETAGVTGTVSSSNSLVGSNTGNGTGDHVGSYGIYALANGNYVVDSPRWNSNEGAVTWGGGAAGVVGTISSANSLVGSTAGSSGDQVGSGGVTTLPNGNYVVDSPSWGAAKGAVTWASGVTVGGGTVSAGNSIVGTTGGAFGDVVGSGGVTALPDGNYVVSSPSWGGGLGAVTWESGAASGQLNFNNSLHGSAGGGAISDEVGSGGVTVLTNGNYVVSSPVWGIDRGAVTWGSEVTGISGAVSAGNSLTGSVGRITVTPLLSNGNYVVASPNWNNNTGAVTWGNGSTGVVGAVSAANSLTGSASNDFVGGVTPLRNGNYVVLSPSWSNNLGAATWESGTAAASAIVSANNSLVGTIPGSSGDQVSSGGVAALPNGNYVVLSPAWNISKGAATWGSGMAGVSGALSLSNSILGTTGGSTGDQVGSGGVTPLADGNLVVSSPLWNGSSGAVTWLDGTTGTTLDGQSNLDAGNSLRGATGSARLDPVQLGPVRGSFVAAFATENNNGRVTVGFVNAGGAGADQLPFGFLPAQTLTLDPGYLQHALNAGTNVVLQANDDITVSSPVTAQPTGTPGNLTLQAGRSLLLKAGIKTAGGNLTLVANDSAADGVVDAQRDPGNAAITEGSGITLDAGPGTLAVDLKATTDTTNHAQGAATLLGLAAGSVTLSAASPLGVTINGSTPGDGVSAGTYTQTTVSGTISLNGAPLQLTHKAATTLGETFTIVHTTGGVSGTFAGLAEGAGAIASDGTLFTITYQANGGKDVVLTQVVSPTQLVVTAQPPARVTAGGTFGLMVSVEDAQGNVATSYPGTVALALARNPTGCMLGGTLTRPVVLGVATFSDLAVDCAGTGYTLRAASSSLTPATTNALDVTTGTAMKLVLATPPPATVTAGVPISPAVTVAVEDAFDNVVTTDASTVTAAVASGPGTLGGTLTANVVNGIATFSNLVLQTAGSYTLNFSDGSLAGATSDAFTTNPAPAHQLAFGVQPGNTLAGAAVSPAVTVQVLDQFGNLLTNDNSDQVTLAIGINPRGGTLGGTTTVTVRGGVATFANLTIDRVGTGYTLSASAAGLPAVASGAFNVTTLIDHMAVGVQPGDTTAGSAVSPAVQVQLFGQSGNVLTGDSSDRVTLTVATGPGGFTPGSTTTVTVSAGVAVFSNLVLDTAGSYTLAVTATGGVAGPNLNPFTVRPSTADHLAFGVAPGNTTAGAALGSPVTVQVVDRYGNTLTADGSDRVTLTVAGGPGGFAPGSATALTVSAGVATFGDLTITTVGTGYTITASAPGLTAVTSAAFAISPAAADHLAFLQAPANATAGQTIDGSASPAGVRVGVFDWYNNLLTADAADTITLAVATGPGGLLGTLTQTVSGGVAVFGNLAFDTAGSYTLRAGSSTQPTLATVSSPGFAISPASADHLAFPQPPTSAMAGAPFSLAVTVQVVDRYGNGVVSDNSDLVILSVAGGPGGFTSGSTFAVTVSAGVATFANLAIDTAGAGYTLTANSAGIASATSTAFTVSPVPTAPPPQPRPGDALPFVSVVRQVQTKRQRKDRRHATFLVSNGGSVSVNSVRLVLVGLSRKVKVRGAGATAQGLPYVTVGPLAAGASTTVTVSFFNRHNVFLGVTAQAQAG